MLNVNTHVDKRDKQHCGMPRATSKLASRGNRRHLILTYRKTTSQQHDRKQLHKNIPDMQPVR